MFKKISCLNADIIDLETLKAARLINKNIKHVKIILSGKLEKPITIKGLMSTKGAKNAIESAGGKVEE